MQPTPSSRTSADASSAAVPSGRGRIGRTAAARPRSCGDRRARCQRDGGATPTTPQRRPRGTSRTPGSRPPQPRAVRGLAPARRTRRRRASAKMRLAGSPTRRPTRPRSTGWRAVRASLEATAWRVLRGGRSSPTVSRRRGRSCHSRTGWVECPRRRARGRMLQLLRDAAERDHQRARVRRTSRVPVSFLRRASSSSARVQSARPR